MASKLSCLDSLIGVKDCIDYNDSCGGYINSLPGITFSRLVGITDAEKMTFAVLWKEIVEEAKSSFRVDFMEKILECREIVSSTNGGCDYESLICKNKSVLVGAWKYKLAIVLFEFHIYSGRVNPYTTILVEEAKELLKMYQEKYSPALKQAIMLIDISAETCCAPCKGNPRTVLWLP